MLEFFKEQEKIITPVAVALSAVLTSFCVMFTQLALLEWVALIPAAVCLYRASDRGISAKRAYLLGLGFFLAYYIVLFHWFVYMYPMDFLGLSGAESVAVVAVAWLGLSLMQAAFSALSLPIFVLVSRHSAVKRKKWLGSILAASLWVLFEWGLTLTWAGVPWSRLALGQTDMLAAVQSASLFGSYFITFLIVLVNFLLAYAILYKRKLAAAVATCAFALNIALGSVLLATYKEGEKITVAAAQGNVSSTEKWNDELFVETFVVYAEYISEAAEKGADIVLLPESVVPYVIKEGDVITDFLSRMVAGSEIYALVGAFSEDDGEDKNSVFLFEPDGSINEKIYSKRRLVPFGEFVPLEGLIKVVIPPLAEINAFSSAFTAGDDSEVMTTEHARLGCLICFDSIYETLALDSVRDSAELIMLSTNDSWFHDSAALEMHNNQARLRAIETRRSVVRAANTGITSIITPTGEVTARIGALKKGLIVEDVELNNGLTLYTRIGNLFVYLCGAFVAVLLAECIKSRYRP